MHGKALHGMLRSWLPWLDLEKDLCWSPSMFLRGIGDMLLLSWGGAFWHVKAILLRHWDMWHCHGTIDKENNQMQVKLSLSKSLTLNISCCWNRFYVRRGQNKKNSWNVKLAKHGVFGDDMEWKSHNQTCMKHCVVMADNTCPLIIHKPCDLPQCCVVIHACKRMLHESDKRHNTIKV